MDFSDVHIVFCDHDKETGSSTLALLQKCTYKVTAVKSARDVIEILKSKAADVDIILTDVELPQEKGFKILKHIVRQEDLGHIAVVDYLVKPLRSNEVMNLWTHMWRKRRMLGLPNKNVGLEGMSFLPSLQKPTKTADLLSGYRNLDHFQVSNTHQPFYSRDATVQPELELSLRLSLNYTTEKLHKHANIVPLAAQTSPPNGRLFHPSAFPANLNSYNFQPDEQSGTNAYSPSSSWSKRSVNSQVNSNNVPQDIQELVNEVPGDHVSNSTYKETSMVDETRSGDIESQMCDEPEGLRVDQVPIPCITTDDSITSGGQTSTKNIQGFQLHHTYIRSSPVCIEQSVASNVQKTTVSGHLYLTCNPPQQQPLPYCHEAGIANIPQVGNSYTFYPSAQVAVPVDSFSSWPNVFSPPPLSGGKLVHLERREAALSRFRMKRKGRCFEKKIRYASRKKSAEQRPRIRGQFVKKIILSNNVISESIADEEGEADDEQGHSEWNKNSFHDSPRENSRAD
ncbi:hypothetical protein KP509_08G065800 [Ceratopteris richardii]|uniref:Uncharacterized protein n=1 Tax=Ceratopteris richardii TaxID=49495 RepID=A0A8T2UER9_CERRI|nr:hypothetical protein KP509_08G065800 [Ceratopteris richardii]